MGSGGAEETELLAAMSAEVKGAGVGVEEMLLVVYVT